MAIPVPQSMGDVSYELNSKAVTDAGVQLILANAQSLTAHMDQLRNITVAAVGKMQQVLIEPDPMSAASAQKILNSSGMDNALISAMAQIMTKAGQTTPPYTAWPFPPKE